MELRIEPNTMNKQQATAWAGRERIADLRRERDGARAKVQLQLPPLATSAELRAMAARCNAVADALDGWGGAPVLNHAEIARLNAGLSVAVVAWLRDVYAGGNPGPTLMEICEQHAGPIAAMLKDRT